MKLEHRILGLLCLKPHTGYDIKKYLDTEGRFMRGAVHFSQLYPTLKSLEKEGKVSFVEEQREGRLDVKIYTVTPAGKQYFLDWLNSPLELTFDHRDSELVPRLSFGGMLDKAVILRMLHSELSFRKSQIAKYRNRDRRIKNIETSEWLDVEREEFMQDLVHEHGAGLMDTYVSWLEKAIERVEKSLPGSDPAKTEEAIKTA